MIIKKLILKSFGKFQNKTIDLQSGMNLFLGENESGKSTLHQFIEGMFYGFYKQNIKNKKTTEAYDKFMPWDNLNDFSGVMIIEDEGRELRIERTFMKNRDLVQIFDNLTGQNITETYPYDPVTKIHQPALKHLGLSQSAYQNTVSISQQKSRTSEELADEIKDNIINLGDTRRVDVSISNIMKILAERKAIIGTQRSKKSNFGKTKEMIGQMENEKMDTGKIWDEIKQLRLQENHLTIDLQALEKNKQRIERKMAFLKDQDGKEIYEKVRQISLELADISNKLVEMSPYANISKDEINDVLIKLNNSDFLKREYDQQVEKVGEMRDRLRSLEAEVLAIDGVIIEIGASEKISRDVYKFEEFENSKKYTGQSVEPDKKLQLEEVLLKKKKTKKVLKVFYVMTMVFTLLFAITKFMEYFGKSLFENIAALQSIHETIVGIVSQLETYSLYTWGGALLMLILTVVLMIVSGQKKSDIKQLEIQKQALLESEEISLNRIKDIDERQALLLSKHVCADLEALKALRDKKVKEELMYEDNYKRARALEDEKEMIEHRLGNEQDKLRQLQLNLEKDMDWIQEVMTKLNLWSDEELKESLQQYDYYKQLESEKQNKEYVLHEITKGKSYLNLDIHEILDEFKDKVAEEEFSEDEFSEETFQEPQEYYEEVASSQERTVENEVENEVEHEVENEAENFESNFGIINYHEEALDNNFYGASMKEETMIANAENYDDLETQLRNLNQSILHINKELTIVSTGIASKENRVRKPALIEEELTKNYDELERMSFKLNTYSIIEEAITHISKNIQENFAPKLNEKISKIISMATDYKYTDVKVSADMDITIVDNELNKLVKVSDLSAGTLDLMFFALRLSIAEITNPEQNIPIVLDDSFVQYDERRLIKMLELITQLDRQVLLFTCHKREAKVIGRIMENVNTINL